MEKMSKGRGGGIWGERERERDRWREKDGERLGRERWDRMGKLQVQKKMQMRRASYAAGWRV